MKIAYTDEFVRIGRDSIERGFNRLLPDEFLDSLDPDGVHILTFNMPHEHIASQRVEPHVRTMWLAKVSGQEKGVDVTLDMTLDNFNALSSVRKTDDGSYEVEIGAHGIGRKR